MPWGSDKFLEAQRGANLSVERANQAADERRRALWANEDLERGLSARAAEQALRLGDARYADEARRGDERFAEDRRRFDTRQSQFDGLMKMLFGGGDDAGGGMNSLRRMRGGGPRMGQPADDGLDRRAINNSLAAYLQGRM